MYNDIFKKIEKTIYKAINKSFYNSVFDNNSAYGEIDLANLLFSNMSNNIVGNVGEQLTRSEVESRLPGYYKVIANILLPIGSVKTEVDLVMIHEKGVFVFESKNYGGWIFGSEKQRSWVQSMPGGKKYNFYNPLLQNRTHCDAVSNALGITADVLFSYIVFSDRCILKSVPSNNFQRTLLKRKDMVEELVKDLLIRDIIYEHHTVDEMYETLLKYIPTEEEMREHKKRIRNQYHKK